MVKLFAQFCIALVVFLLVSSYQEKDMLADSGKQPAPYFSLPTLSSQERISLASLQGKKTVVYFFAPWCKVCKLSMPNLNKLYEQKNINAIAIALDYDNVEQVQNFAADIDLTMPILLGNHNIAANYQISAYPSYYVLDENSHIIARSVGYSSELGLRLRM